MGTYFKPWSRKLGVAMLAVSCVYTAAWVRSETWMDRLDTSVANSVYGIGSYAGKLEIHRWDSIQGQQVNLFWRSALLNDIYEFKQDEHGNVEPDDIMVGWRVDWRWDFAGFHLGAGTDSTGTRFEHCILPFWSIVIPLTVLSAYLLLSKLRPKSPLPEPNVHQ